MRLLARASHAGLVITLLLVAAPRAAADAVRDGQWHLSYLGIARAHAISQGEHITVAVLDTGIDTGHPDLLGSAVAGADFTRGGGDSSGDAWVDEDGHGTAMAGLIAAHGRALGIAPKATILPVRVATRSRPIVQLPSNADVDGLNWAIDHGASVICFAAGGGPSPGLEAAVRRALANDVVVVAAAGNLPDDRTVAFPAAYHGVVAAVGTDRTGGHATVSATGPEAVLAAPAVDIESTYLRKGRFAGYSVSDGTSNATAIIAGVAALVRSRFPELSAAEVVHRLTATADDRGPPGRDDIFGYGIVDPVRALTAEVPALPTSASASPANPVAGAGSGPGADPFLVVTLGGAAVLVLVIVAMVILRGRRAGAQAHANVHPPDL